MTIIINILQLMGLCLLSLITLGLLIWGGLGWYRYTRLKNDLQRLYTHNRIGFYRGGVGYRDYHMEVMEIEAYKNDYSRIKITKVVGETSYKAVVAKWGQKGFLVKTNEITWLERDKNLLEMRREKLTRVLEE